jgi:hypothetical protein
MTKEMFIRELTKKMTGCDRLSGLSLTRACIERNGGTCHNVSSVTVQGQNS